MSKVGETLKYHYFEVVTSEILDFEGQKYEEVDYFSKVCCSMSFSHYLGIKLGILICLEIV